MPLQFESLSSHGLRRLVRDLRHALVNVGQPPMSQHVAQEVVARQLGHANWHVAHQQAVRVDRAQDHADTRQPGPASAPANPLNPHPTALSAERATVSDEALKNLPLFPVEVSPEAQAVIALLREGNALYDSARAYHAMRQEKDQKAYPKDGWEFEVAQEHIIASNWDLSLALATTEGPWIQGWRLADGQGLHSEKTDEVMSDEAFDTVVRFLMGKNVKPPIDTSDIALLMSGGYRYERSPYVLIEHGRMDGNSIARDLLESSQFEKEVREDLRTALKKLKPVLLDSSDASKSLSYEDAFGAIQRLISLVAHVHPHPSVNRESQISQPQKMREPSRLGNLHLRYALTLQEVQDELRAQIQENPSAVITLDASAQDMVVKLRKKVAELVSSEPELSSRRRRSRHP